jgi:hypothetical protein
MKQTPFSLQVLPSLLGAPKPTKITENSLFPAQRSFALHVQQGSASGGRDFGEPSLSIIRGVRVIRMLKVTPLFIPGAPAQRAYP